MNDGPACEDYNGPYLPDMVGRYAVIGEDGFMRVYEGHAVTHIKTGDAGRCDKCGGFVSNVQRFMSDFGNVTMNGSVHSELPADDDMRDDLAWDDSDDVVTI